MAILLGADESDPEPLRCAKIARLHALAAAGLPVPQGLAVSSAGAEIRAHRGQIEAWLAAGPIIVRGANRGEDAADSSQAGLGRSVSDRKSVAEVDAGAEELLSEGADAILIQPTVPRRWLVVAAGSADAGSDIPVHVETHANTSGPTPLADGRQPDYSGPLSTWPDDARRSVVALVAQVREHIACGDRDAFLRGFDAEVVVDFEGRAWLVQLRPLVADLLPGWSRFRAAVAAAGETIPADGILTLDGEHNPAPLSPAHAWLMRWLSQQRPGRAGDPMVLAGWLYVRTLPRDLADSRSQPTTAEDPRTLLRALRDRYLPVARERWKTIQTRLANAASPSELRGAFADAQHHFLAMIDLYVGTLAPARGTAGGQRIARPEQPLTLSSRDQFFDALPIEWDLCSPSLAGHLGPRDQDPNAHAPIPDDPATAATLLGEWDDHLFALGLAPLREVWLAAGPILGLDAHDVFLVDGDELLEWAEHPPDRRKSDLILDARRERRTRAAALMPPERIEHGRPVVRMPGERLHGHPIGPPAKGALTHRRHLGELLDRPPAKGQIVCMPTLTAHAAVALDRSAVQAVVTEYGGALSHASLMARELGISALVGCTGCTSIPEGTPVHLDTTTGRLRLGAPKLR